MPYDVIGAVLGLVALIAAGIARQSINKAAKLDHKLDELREDMTDLLAEVGALRAELAARREKKKRGVG
jgi:outer membrane murein-binding lipoprotein Lpp